MCLALNTFFVIESSEEPTKKIILFTSKRVDLYSYEYIYNITYARLCEKFKQFIHFHQAEYVPYAQPYTLVTGDTVSDLLDTLQSIHTKKGTRIKLAVIRDLKLGDANISTEEIKLICNEIYRYPDDLDISLLDINGIQIENCEVEYDIHSILT